MRAGQVPIDRAKVRPMPKAATKTKSKKPSESGEINKSQFIRERMHLTPAQTVAEAKALKVKLSTAMVYSVRSETKKKSGKANGAPKASNPTGSKPAKQTASGQDNVSVGVAKGDKETLRKLMREYGSRVVRTLMEQIERE